jgi:hypothetical protein
MNILLVAQKAFPGAAFARDSVRFVFWKYPRKDPIFSRRSCVAPRGHIRAHQKSPEVNVNKRSTTMPERETITDRTFVALKAENALLRNANGSIHKKSG